MPRHHSQEPQAQALASPATRMLRPLVPAGQGDPVLADRHRQAGAEQGAEEVEEGGQQDGHAWA